MDISRRAMLVGLAAGSFMPLAQIRLAAAQDGPQRVIDVRIENRKVVVPDGAIRITEGELVELRWTSDEAVDLHIHGYDLGISVEPDEPARMVLEAHATGRFPIASHGWERGGGGHGALTYLEVYPR